MNKTTKIGLAAFSIFLFIIFIFAKGLGKDPTNLGQTVANTKIVNFSLPDLFDTTKQVTNNSLTSDKPYYLINIFGTWCPACIQEHPYLTKLSESETIYAINWKDEDESARNFLKTNHNPYKRVMVDRNSELIMSLGVYGAPETFLIKKDGTIVYRHTGPLDEVVWQDKFMPLIEKL